MNLLTILAQDPELAVISKDQAQCKEILCALGLLDEPVKSTSPNLWLCTAHGHKTHWITVAFYSGHPATKFNGYKIYCLPKSLQTEQDAREAKTRIGQDYGGHSVEEWTPQHPDEKGKKKLSQSHPRTIKR